MNIIPIIIPKIAPTTPINTPSKTTILTGNVFFPPTTLKIPNSLTFSSVEVERIEFIKIAVMSIDIPVINQKIIVIPISINCWVLNSCSFGIDTE